MTVSQLDKLHSKHLLPGFKDRSAEEREIQSLATSITSVRRMAPSRVSSAKSLLIVDGKTRCQDLRSCQNYIRRIAEQSKQLLHEVSNPSSGSSAESKRVDLLMAANVQTALATKVQTLSTTFRKKQSEYLRRKLEIRTAPSLVWPLRESRCPQNSRATKVDRAASAWAAAQTLWHLWQKTSKT